MGFGGNGFGHDQLGLGEAYKDTNSIETQIMNPYFKGDSSDNMIVFIECGHHHSLCISKNGKAYMFGDNSSGQCGNGTTDDYDYYGVFIPFCIQSMRRYKDILFESGSCGFGHTVLISIILS